MHEDYKKIAEVAALAGRIMLESHAESYRVEDTVRRILQTSGLSKTEVVTTTTGLYFMLDDDDPKTDPITMVLRVSNRGNHLNKIYRVNNISRQITNHEITLAEAREKLYVVDDSEYTAYNKDFGIILLVVAFTVLLGGSFYEVLLSIIAGLVVALSRIGKELFDLNDFTFNVFATFVTSIVITAVTNIIPISASSGIIITAAFMPLYPGTAFTNGIRDTLQGDYISGVARIADAFVTALSLAIGVAMGLFVEGQVASWIM